MRIFDVHAHLFADGEGARMTGAIAAFYREYGLTPHGAGELSDCVRQMDGAGIEKFALNQVAMRPRMAARVNALILDAQRRYPGRVIPFAAIHPEEKDIDAYVEFVRAAGFKGFKVHPDMQRFALDGEAALRMFRAVEASGLPVLIHCGDPRFDFDGPRRVAALKERLPGLKAINAHFGGWSQLDEAARLLPGRGILVDCSGVLGDLEPQRAADMIRAFGVKNVLFGSDYPMYAPGEAVERFMKLPLTDDERADILWNNADRIIGLD